MADQVIDLDEHEPRELLRRIEAVKDLINTSYVNGQESYVKQMRLYGHFRADKLLDWRKLERRMVELKAIEQRYHESFWNELHRLYAEAVKRDASNVWICHPSTDRRNDIMQFDGRGLRNVDPASLVDAHVKTAKLCALIVKDAEAVEMYDRYERSHAFLRRSEAYKRAFTVAVEHRIITFLRATAKSHQHHVDYSLPEHRPQTFIVTNDGRHYIAQSDFHGRVTFLHDNSTVVCT